MAARRSSPLPIWPRMKAVRRALPRTWSSRTSLSGTLRVGLIDFRLARMLADASQVPRPGADHVGGLPGLAGGQRVPALDDGDHRGLRQHPDEVERPVAGEDGAQPVPGLEAPPVVDVATQAERLEVADLRGRDDEHPGAGDVGPPAEVEVLAEVVDAGVVAAERGEQVGPHQRAAPGHDEHVAHRVVLLLVQLARLGVRREDAGLVHRGADLTQLAGHVPGDELGPDHARRSSGTPPRRACGSCRGRGPRRRGRSGRRRRPRPSPAPRWRPRRSRRCGRSAGRRPWAGPTRCGRSGSPRWRRR